jgi:hypothetical protein
MRTRYTRNGELPIACELRGKLHWQRPWLVLIQGMGFGRHGLPLFWQDPDGFATVVISFLLNTGGNEGNQSTAAPGARSGDRLAAAACQCVRAP